MPRINSLNTFVLSTVINSVGGGGAEPEQANYQGATMVFVLQGTAPTGWVKVTADTDYTLRCVTGSALSGGTSNFSTVMSPKTLTAAIPISGSVGATTLTTSQMGTHSHPTTAGFTTVGIAIMSATGPGTGFTASPTFYTGSIAASPTSPGVTAGQSHTHPAYPSSPTTPATLATVNLTVKYVEAILATRS